jgi:hypothetical protein
MLGIGSHHHQQGKCNINTCIEQKMGKIPTSERGNNKKTNQDNMNKK